MRFHTRKSMISVEIVLSSVPYSTNIRQDIRNMKHLLTTATHIAFLSDVVEELDAATQAGMTTVWVQRQGELQHRSPHLSVRDFSEIDF